MPETCQWKAAQRMAQAGLGGAVTLTAGSALHFEIIHTLAPGQAADASAQLIWTAFDVALALDGESQCDSFTQVEVTITVQQDNQANTRINASVNAADLAAFGAGELSEDEFIERVIYTVNER